MKRSLHNLCKSTGYRDILVIVAFFFNCLLMGKMNAAENPSIPAHPALSDVPDTSFLLNLPEKQIPGLQNYVNKALEIAPTVIGARLQVLAVEASEDVSRSLTRPHANVYSNFVNRKDNINNQWLYAHDYNAFISQPLWHWNALDNQKSIARIQRQLADNDYDEARRSLVLTIRQTYLNLILQKLALKQTETYYNEQSGYLKFSVGQAQRGEISPDALATSQSTILAAALALDRQRESFKRALRDFAVFNGLQTFSADGLPDAIPGVAASTLALLAQRDAPQAEDKRIPLALASTEAAVKTAKLNLDITRVRTRPMVDLTFSMNQGQVSAVDQTPVTTYYAGVSVSWNIFDGFATRAAVRQARVVVRQSEKALDEARQALARQLADSTADLDFAVRELKIAEERYALTLEKQRNDERLLQVGQISQGDFNGRQRAAIAERNALYAARGNLILQLAAYELARQRATKPSAEIPFP